MSKMIISYLDKFKVGTHMDGFMVYTKVYGSVNLYLKKFFNDQVPRH